MRIVLRDFSLDTSMDEASAAVLPRRRVSPPVDQRCGDVHIAPGWGKADVKGYRKIRLCLKTPRGLGAVG